MAETNGRLQEARHRFGARLQSALTLEEVSGTFMDDVGDVVRARSIGVYRLDTDSGEVLEVRSDANPNFLEDYEEFGRADDPVLDFVLRQQRPIDSTRVVTPRDWQACGARSALGGAGLDHSMEAPLVASGIFLGTVNFARPGDQPAFSDDDLVSARIISEQLGLATERAIRFESTGHRATLMESALDRIQQAVIVTDLDAQVLFRNRAARRDPDLLASNPVGIDREPSVGQSIAEAMEEFRVKGKRVYLRSLRSARGSQQRIVKSYRLGGNEGAAVTLVFDCNSGRDARALPAWDVLSKREQEIAQLVSEGLTTKQIADRAFISENTVKQHLKRVFAKTDVRNRAELVQMIWASGQRSGDQGHSAS